MKNLMVESNPDVKKVIDGYDKAISDKLMNLRRIILETSNEIEDIIKIEETLKWGEPSYVVNKGSTIRMDWKAKNPSQYAIYFKCTSKLVTTFQEVFGDKFKYEKTRAILFDLDEEIPEKELKQCIAMALRYHKVKHLPLLGYLD